MYSTCLFCQQDLGRNETFEGFPVGRRIAYDAARGRLWVVCRRCARWNLTPLEERWDAIDEAERRFRASRLRASTGEIALARLPEGTELVRIGAPPRLELAAWRYGDQLGRRRRQFLIATGGLLAVGGAVLTGGVLAGGIGVITAWQLGQALHRGTQEGAPWTTVARLRAPSGELLRIRHAHLKRMRIGESATGALQLAIYRNAHDAQRERSGVVLEGDAARKALGQLLPAVNRMGGTRDEIDMALGRIDGAASIEGFFAMVGRHGARLTRVRRELSFARRLITTDDRPQVTGFGLHGLPRSLALAIEIAANEERERRAMEGELALLEAAWKEAEEIAQIADAL